MKFEKEPFELRAPVSLFLRERKPTLFVSKQIYNDPRIKISDWQYYYGSFARDNDDPIETSKFSTTTNDMLEQIQQKYQYEKRYETNPKINYFTYSKYCEEILSKIKIPPTYVCDYLTTMKNDYLAPEQFESTLKAQTENIIPKNLYRRKNCMGDENSCTKFFDDNTIDCMRELQCLKTKLFRSYDFTRGQYTDGTVPKE